MPPTAQKQLRTSLSAVENVFMLLMPASQAVAWKLVLDADDPRRALFYISLFYALWAVKNRLSGITRERGYYGFALVCLGTSFADQNDLTRRITLAGIGGVFGAFILAAMLVLPWPVAKTAYLFKKTTTWAHVLRMYYISSLGFWAFALRKLWQSR